MLQETFATVRAALAMWFLRWRDMVAPNAGECAAKPAYISLDEPAAHDIAHHSARDALRHALFDF